MQIIAIGRDKSSLLINAKMLLEKLGLDEDTLTADEFCNALLNLTDEERENIFTGCSDVPREVLHLIEGFHLRDISFYEDGLPHLNPEIFKMEQRNCFDDFYEMNHQYCRTPEEIKRNLKFEKNPMRIKQLNRELTDSCRFWKWKKGR